MTLDRRLQCLLWLYITTFQVVTGLSVVVSPSPTVEVVSGQTLSITCQWSADYSGPNAAVNYKLNDGEGRIGTMFINFGTLCKQEPPYTLTCNRDTRTLGIQIPANSYSHGDRWTCEGRNDNTDNTTPPQTDTTTVDIIVGPGTVSLSPPDTTYTKTEGDTLPDITCTADCRPGCTFVWTRPDNTNFTASAVLSLGQLDRSEHGTYTCTARNIVGESTTTVIVSVMYGPSSVGLSPPTTSYTPIEGQTLPTVACSSDCYPVCTFSWTKDGQSHTTGSDLQLTNIQQGQTGVYRCTASNTYGSRTSSDVTVTVNYGPGTVTLSPPDTSYTRTVGDNLPDITCTADCRPGCTFVWSKPDNTNLTASAVLSLGQLDRSEHGTYKCTAGNIYGSLTISAVVNVQFGPGTVTLSPPDTTYTKTEGDTLPGITCTADCRPDCTFVWTKPDNTNFTALAVLSLGQLDRSERGTYRCTARNVVRELTTVTSVTILYGPSNVSLTPSTTSYTPIEGQTLPTVTCSSDCYPVCTYSWTKDGQPHTTGSDLQLTNIQRGQTGVYRCTASSTYGSRTSSDVSVTVNYGPGTSTSISPPGTTYTKTEGETLPNITCTADCRPGCTFVWTKPDNTNFTASAVLSLGQLDRSEHGTYRCTAGNLAGESTTTTSVIVTVQYGPSTVTLSPPNTTYTRTEGDMLPDITCTADCRPDCSIVWTKPDNTNFTASAMLSLGQLDRSEHGTYICTAWNVVGTSKTTTNVIVQYGPGDSITFEPMQYVVERVENQTVPNIKCSADCRPPCTYSWSKSGKVRPNPLSLSKVTRNNAGTYTCTASNTINKGTKDWDLVVKFPPEIDSLDYNQGDADVTEHGSKTLMCKVESVPSSTITWYYTNNDTQLLTATDVLESRYILTSAGCLDTGLYTCSARNNVSNTAVTKDIRINVLCSPRLDPRVFTDREMGLATHDNLTMNAMFLSNPEPSSFTWTFQNSSNNSFTELNNGTDSFVIHNTPFTSNLSVLSMGTRTNIQEAWFGLYNVTAINSEGKGTLTFTVAATENPNPTKIVSVDCGKQMSAKVSWKDSGNSQFYRVLFSMDAFEHSKEVYPVTIAFEEGRNMYSLNVDNLVGGRLYTFKIAAYNTYGNTTSFDAVGCTIQAECSRGTDSMYVTAVALICTSVLTFLLTVGLGLFLSRNGRLPFIKGQHLKRREFQNVQLSERAVPPNEEGDERSPYEQLDTNEITKASVYSEIGSHLPGRRKDPVNDKEYESLEGRSNPNVYEDLHGTTSGDKEIYINTAIAEGGSGSGS